MAESRLGVCAIVRDEERDIAEWLAFHLAVGFDAITVYDNASTDSTPDIVRRFAGKHDVRLIDWPTTAETAQPDAYRDCLASEFGFEHQWIAFIDADELIVPKRGNVRDLIDANLLAGSICLHWAVFGSSGHRTRPPGLMIETFQRRAKSDFSACRAGKQIVRPSQVKEVYGACWFDAHGMMTAAGHPATRDRLQRPDHSVAQINHYYTKTRAEWDQRRARGYRSGIQTRRQTRRFEEFDRNELYDHAALRFVPRVKEILAEVGMFRHAC